MNRNLIFIHSNESYSAISVHLRFDLCVSPIENITKNRKFDRKFVVRSLTVTLRTGSTEPIDRILEF